MSTRIAEQQYIALAGALAVLGLADLDGMPAVRLDALETLLAAALAHVRAAVQAAAEKEAT